MGIHKEPIHSIFNDRYKGSDLEFADIKTCNNDYNQYAIKPKDLSVPYLLCFNFRTSEGFIVPTISINDSFSVKTSLKEKHVKLLSIFNCNSLEELKQKYYELEKEIKVNKHEKNIE